MAWRLDWAIFKLVDLLKVGEWNASSMLVRSVIRHGHPHKAVSRKLARASNADLFPKIQFVYRVVLANVQRQAAVSRVAE